MITHNQLIRQIQKHTPYCCPHTYFPHRKTWPLANIAEELCVPGQGIAALRKEKFTVENIRCWRCRIKEFFRGL